VAGLRTKRSGVSKLGARDLEIAGAVQTVGLLSAKQIQVFGFSLDNYTACKRRLTKLYKYGVLKRLPRDSVSDQYVYYLKKLPSISLLEHNLSVSEVYVRIYRATRDLGWTLPIWQGPDTLQPLLSQRPKLAPDAYFQIQRTVEGQTRTAGFFLECEHSIQRHGVLSHKLTRYSDLLYSGQYREMFQTRAMRVLVVYHSTLTTPSTKRVQQGLATARKLGITLVRFTTLEAVTSHSPIELLTSPIWYRPDQNQPVPLFQLQSEEQHEE
jgi:hypothetical protein